MITRRLCCRHFVDKSQSRFRQVADNFFFFAPDPKICEHGQAFLLRVQLSLIRAILRRRKTLRKELEKPPRRKRRFWVRPMLQKRAEYELNIALEDVFPQ